jgi:hypothetical protein
VDLQVGDSVVVKSGVLDPDLGSEIGGWQGRIEEVDEGGTVLIRWDSITLRQMGFDMVIQCENDGLDWESMNLDIIEVKKAMARDTEADVRAVVSLLKAEVSEHLQVNDEDDPDLDE